MLRRSVWAFSSETRRSFSVGTLPWMKYRFTTICRNLNVSHLSEQRPVKAARNAQRLNDWLEKSWHPFFGMERKSFTLMKLKKVKPSTANITLLCWSDRRPKPQKTAARGAQEDHVPPRQRAVSQVTKNDGEIVRIRLLTAAAPTVFSRSCPQRLLALCTTSKMTGREKISFRQRDDHRMWEVFCTSRQIILQKRYWNVRKTLDWLYHSSRELSWWIKTIFGKKCFFPICLATYWPMC